MHKNFDEIIPPAAIFVNISSSGSWAKNEFFVNSAESSRLIYDFVLKSMKEAGVGMPFFPGGLFYAAWFPQPKFYCLHGRPVRRRCARPVSFRMRMYMHSPLRRCAREEHFLLRRILRGGARAAHLVLCAHFLAEGRSPERGKPGSIFRTGTAFSARSGCSKAASARERSMLSSAARAAGRSCASRAARERSASPVRAAGTPLKRRPEEEAPPSVKI